MLNALPILAEGEAINITTGLSNIMTAGTTVMNFITSDNLLMTLFCGSIVGVACMFIRKVKKTAKA